MEYLPIFLSLSNRKVVVIGGGDVACRKIDLLRKAGAAITVVSPALHPYLKELSKHKQILWVNKQYASSDLDGAFQVWATTNDQNLNHQVFIDAETKGIWTNVVDDRDYCHFITPSIIDRSPIQIAVSSGGASPVLVRYLREKLETQLPQNLGLLASYAGKQRNRIKQHFDSVGERRKFWEGFFRHPLTLQAQSESTLEHIFQQLLNTDDHVPDGGLYLIETNTDPELLSIKALRLMQQAECILYPDDPDSIFVELCRRDADRAHYAIDTLEQQVESLLSQGIRVCILANKQKASSSLRPLSKVEYAEYMECV
ncbi:NAD(P)-dependent oxidoreductase [Photobacterium nomapromontoriensis]|uniref:precorrin-2 dehydrogenase/sirohydrochlorin ferrochelatase family protein n=1 Tax=Photobacterium nomapromontoriensis TaxID=2910237 RepID=UPI003D125E72